MNEILFKVQAFLDRANRETVELSDELLDEFAASCRAALKKQFNDKRNERFTIRMSNIGRPLCQLQMEAAGTDAEVPSYSHKMKMLIGDMIEAAAITIMRAADVNVEKTQGAVHLQVEDVTIQGTYDVKIDGQIYDIKSASSYAFAHKFGEDGFRNLCSDDSFGYVAQGFGYAEADGARFGGWIAIDKSTGEWSVASVPSDQSEYEEARRDALDTITQNVKALSNGAEFKRCFTDVNELYYGKPTGNKVLPFSCEYCAFKSACWKSLKTLPKLSSKGQFPKLVNYTYIDKGK